MNTCKESDCEAVVVARGWCRKHYMRWKRHGDPQVRSAPKMKKVCVVSGCAEVSKSKSMCQKHYDAKRYEARSNDPLWLERERERRSKQYRKHRHVRLANMKDYYATNSDRLKAKASERRQWLSRDILNAQARERYKADLERNRDRKRMSRQIRRTREAMQVVYEIADKDLRRLYASRCTYCGTDGSMTLDHVIPVSRGGSLGIGNLAPACESCNKSKRDRLPIEYRVWKQRKAAA